MPSVDISTLLKTADRYLRRIYGRPTTLTDLSLTQGQTQIVSAQARWLPTDVGIQLTSQNGISVLPQDSRIATVIDQRTATLNSPALSTVASLITSLGYRPADIDGLTAFADQCAAKALSSPVQIISSSSEGGAGSGVITLPSEVWLTAAEELLADPRFNLAAAPQPPRIVSPDYRFVST